MIRIVPLKYEYCESVYEIAKQCLPEHWSLDGIRDVLKYDNNIYYIAIKSPFNYSNVNDSDTCNSNTNHINSYDIAGFAGIMIVADEAELLNIAVKEEYRKQGIAYSLLNQLINDAETVDCSRMLLEVRKSNSVAKCLYEKMGFCELGVRKNYYSNPVDDAIIMERVI